MQKMWLLFDGRYRTDPDRAMVMTTADSLEEAQEDISMFGDDTVIVEYDVDGDELINPKTVN